MGVDRDINQMQARHWKTDVSKISSIKLKNPSSKSSFLDAIKLVVSKQVNILRENENSSKIKFIVDMLLERIRAAIEKTGFVEKIEEHFQKFDQTIIIQKIEEKIALETIPTNYRDLAQKIVNSILESIDFPENFASTQKNESSSHDTAISNENKTTKPQYKAKSKEKTSIQLFDPSSILASLDKQLKLIKKFTAAGLSVAKILNTGSNNDIVEIDDASLATIEKKIDVAIASLDRNLKMLEKFVQLSSEKISQQSSVQTTTKNQISSFSNIAQPKTKEKNKKKNSIAFLPYQQFVLDNVVQRLNKIGKLACTGINSVLPETRIDKISAYLSDILKKVSKKESFFEKMLKFFTKQVLFKTVIDPLKNILFGLLAPFFKSIFPSVSKAIEKITNLINNIKERLVAFGNLVLDFFKLVGKGLKFAVKKAFQIFKKLFDATMKGFKAIFNLIKPLFSGLKSILKAGIIGIKRGLLWGWNKLKNSKFGKYIGEKLGKLTSKAKNIAAKVLKPLKAFGKFIGKPFKFVGNFFKRIGSGISKIKQFGKNAIKSIANIGKNLKNAVVGQVKKLGKKIAGFAKKAMKRIFSRLGSKLKTIGTKFIAKLMKTRVKKIVTKILARFAVGQAVGSTFPGVGNIIMALISTYMTIKDCIEIFNDIKDFLDKNPEVANAIKDGISEVLSKATDFFNSICDFGKKLFNKIFVEGPKKLAKAFTHALNFISNPFSAKSLNDAKNAQEAELISICDEEFSNLAKMPHEKRMQVIDDLLAKNESKIDGLRSKADELTKQIAEEEDSWWPSSKKILELTAKRHELFKEMTRFAAQAGLSEFTKQAFQDARDHRKNAELKKAQILARKEKMQAIEEMAARYKNKAIDLEALDDLCKEQVKKIVDFGIAVKEFKASFSEKAQNYVFQLKKLAMPQNAT